MPALKQNKNITQKRFIGLLIAASVLTLSFAVFLFLPYFQNYNPTTKQFLDVVSGFQVSFGANKVKGNIIMMITQISGCLAGLLSVIYVFFAAFSKKVNSKSVFVLAIIVALNAVALAGMFLAGPLFEASNDTKYGTIIFSWSFYVSAIALGLSILLFIFYIIIVASLKGENK